MLNEIIQLLLQCNDQYKIMTVGRLNTSCMNFTVIMSILAVIVGLLFSMNLAVIMGLSLIMNLAVIMGLLFTNFQQWMHRKWWVILTVSRETSRKWFREMKSNFLWDFKKHSTLHENYDIHSFTRHSFSWRVEQKCILKNTNCFKIWSYVENEKQEKLQSQVHDCVLDLQNKER